MIVGHCIADAIMDLQQFASLLNVFFKATWPRILSLPKMTLDLQYFIRQTFGMPDFCSQPRAAPSCSLFHTVTCCFSGLVACATFYEAYTEKVGS